MALSIVQAQYHIYHTDLSGYLAGADMVQDALTRYALGGKFPLFFFVFFALYVIVVASGDFYEKGDRRAVDR